MTEFVGGANPGVPVAVGDAYSDAATIGPAPQVKQLTLSVISANAAIIRCYRYTNPERTKWELETAERTVPGQSIGLTLDGCAGYMVRNAVAGKTATVLGELTLEGDVALGNLNVTPAAIDNTGNTGPGTTVTELTTPGSGTFQLPANAVKLVVICVGSGGGGAGGGRSGATATSAGGGGGGGGGACVLATYSAARLRALFPTGVPYKVGQGGAGGAAQAGVGNGGNGGDGDTTTFGSVLLMQQVAGGGGGGTGGVSGGTGNSNGGSGGGFTTPHLAGIAKPGQTAGSLGFASLGVQANAASGSQSEYGGAPGGGGSGGGGGSVYGGPGGGSGGTYANGAGVTHGAGGVTQYTAGGAAVAGAGGGDGLNTGPWCGAGGDGGGNQSGINPFTPAAVNGGKGGTGAGGGGGGAAATSTSGAGGAGGNGKIIVVVN